MCRPAVIAAACLIAFLNLVVTAQQAPPTQAPVFRSSVDLVHLDVSVLDKDRRPVRGLTADEFTVLEDGRPQSIVAFSAVDVPDPEPPAAPWMRRVSPDVQSNEGAQDPEGRLFVLLLDDAMIPPHPASLDTARQVARKFIDRVTPADRVAVVFSASGRNQNFTNDRARLLQAIDSLQAGHATHLGGWETARDPKSPVDPVLIALDVPGPAYDPDTSYRMASMQTLRQVAETLISAPQRRKALIFVSPGIAIDDASSAIPTKADPSVRASMKDANLQLLREMPELFLRMRRANVTIYPVDPCGAGGFEAYVFGAASSVPGLRTLNDPLPAIFDWLNPGTAVPRPEDLSRHMGSLTLDFLETAATDTGGLAVVNTNDFDAGLDHIFRENNSYYLIGYQQPAGSAPGSLHRLSVKVNRPDVEVRTRSGYYTAEAPKPDKSGKAAPVSPLNQAIAGAVPNGAFPMRVAFAPVVVPGRKDPTVTIVLGMAQPPVSTRTVYKVDLQTNAYLPDGRPKIIGQRHTATVVLVPTDDEGHAQYDLLSEITLPPGRYELRLSAHRSLDNVSGSLYADVEVPDFAKAPLSVSGVMVEALPSGATAPPGAFDAFVPVVPTSNRAFRSSDDVTAFMRVYQGGKTPIAPVTVVARLTDSGDTVVGEGRETFGGDRFYVGGRAADYKFGIPLAKLPPGPYLLTFDITLDRAIVSRAVQFTVVAK